MSTPATTLADLAGAGGIRPVHAVWQLACALTTRSDLCVSIGNADHPVDQVLHRDLDTGRVELRGTTIAGVLRHALDHRLQGHTRDPRRAEHPRVRLLFGGPEETDAATALTVFDAAVDGSDSGVALRSGVALDPARGVAVPGALYTSEVLRAGARFTVSFELIVDRADRERELLALLVSVAAELTATGVRFGRRTATGNGVVHAERWTARRIDPSTPDGWCRWRLPTHQDRRAADRTRCADSPHATLVDAITSAWSDAPADLAPEPDLRTAAVFTAVLTPNQAPEAAGTLLIRDRPTSRSDEHTPDNAHRFERGGAVIQGSSLHDALRAHARRVLSALAPCADLGPHDPDPCPACRARKTVLTGLWGGERGESSPRPGRLRITEPVLTGATRARITRIRIERLDGHVTNTALVSDEVAVGGAGQVTLTLIDPTDADLALLTHVLLDLHDGLATVGGAIGAGHGLLRLAEATLTLDGQPWTIDRLRTDPALRTWSAALTRALATAGQEQR